MTNTKPTVTPREYIEIGAGYVVATKGDGSTYRIHAPDDEYVIVPLPSYYPFYTQMAKAIAAEREAASIELERLRAALKVIANANGSARPDASWDADTLLGELRKLARIALEGGK
jgi:hypothetical protein